MTILDTIPRARRRAPIAEPFRQMSNRDAKPLSRVSLETLISAFIRDANGMIFYVQRQQKNGPALCFPVRDDGKILRTVASACPPQDSLVDTVMYCDLGIKRIERV